MGRTFHDRRFGSILPDIRQNTPKTAITDGSDRGTRGERGPDLRHREPAVTNVADHATITNSHAAKRPPPRRSNRHAGPKPTRFSEKPIGTTAASAIGTSPAGRDDSRNGVWPKLNKIGLRRDGGTCRDQVERREVHAPRI